MDVNLPDGRVLKGVPEGTTKAEIAQKLGVTVDELSQPKQSQPESANVQEQPLSVKPTSLQSMPEGLVQQAGMMARGGFQGITGGAGDEILAAASALPISALSYAMPSARNVSPSEAYDIALQTSRNELKQGREQYPKTMMGAEIGGNIATGTTLAATKPMQAIANWAGGGSLASRAAKIYATATPTIGATMFAEGQGGAKNRLENASMAPVYGLAAPILGGFGKGLGSPSMTGTAIRGGTGGAVIGAGIGAYNAPEGEKVQGAIEGGLTGAAIGAVGAPILRKANEALGTKSVIPNSEQLRKQASNLYKLADEQGGVLKPEVTNDFLDTLNSLRPQSEMGKLVSGDSAFTKTLDNFNTIRNRPMTLQDAQELDEALGDAIDSFTELGKVTKQGKKLLDVQTALRNKINDATEEMTIGGKQGFDTWKQGQKLWSASRKLNDIERIINRADMMENPATAIKTGFSTLLSNPQRLKGYSPSEISAMKEAANTGFVTDTLKGIFGSRLNGVISGAVGGPLAGVAGAATSAASRGLAEKVQVGKAMKAAEMVATQGKGQEINPLITVDKIKQIMKLSPKQAKIELDKLKNSDVGKFVKDYIADESGALKILPDKVTTLKSDKILFHGTSAENRLGIMREGFKSSKEMPEGFVGGGGYGQKQSGISFSTKEKAASNFATSNQYGAIIPTEIKKGTKIIDLPQYEYAEDIPENLINDLKKKGIGGIKIGSGEDEIVIIDKSVIKNILPNSPEKATTFSKRTQFRETNIND